MRQQLADQLIPILERADKIRGAVLTVIEANGSVTTSLVFGTDHGVAMIGALEISKDQIKAGMTVGPAPTA